jgi:hypothetical protein
MTAASLLTDQLFEDVMAAGQADVLVALPTRNHARTVGAVAQAVIGAFSGRFGRQRTVLLNVDGNSSDGTPELVQNLAAPAGDIVTGQYALRTIHRITAPYHGVPGRSTALRTIFTVAELLRVRALVIADPTAVAASADDFARWIGAIWTGGADYVKPVIPRAAGDGPLVTQLVRPLLRATCGVQLAEPLDTQLACSGAFVGRALAADFWTLPAAEVGVDAFLTIFALTSKVRLAQVATAACGHVDAGRRPRTAEVFQQVVGSLFEALARSFALWADTTGSQPVPTEGKLPAAPSRLPRFRQTSLTAAFRNGLDALVPLLSPVLGAPIVEGWRTAADRLPVALSDELWARTVLAFLAAAVRGSPPTRELAQMLEPLYLGRVASMLGDLNRGEWTENLEQLALTFEGHKPELVSGLRGKEEDHDGKSNSRDLAASA